MNDINLFKLINAAGWTLLNSLWQITIVGAIIWLVFRLISKDNAKLRYGIASIGLSFVFVSFILTFVHYYLKRTGTMVETGNIDPEMMLLLLKNSSSSSDFFSFDNINFARYFPVIVNLWCIGVCVLSLHMTFNYLQSLKLKKHLTYPISNKTQKLASNLIKRFHLKQKVTFKESGYVQTPSLIGYFKPVVLLPVSMLSCIPYNQLEIIIAHELAHIKRHDYLFQFVQGILELLFFYHPVVWWLSSVVNTEREHICDDLAVKVCGESLTLIKALNNMEAIRKKRFELVLGLSGKKDNLFNRVQRILRPKAELGKRSDKLLISGLFVFLFSGLILISNFAISENAFSGKQFFSKINVIDQKQNKKTDNNAVPLQQDKKKKKKNKKANTTLESTETVKVETETKDEVEITSEVEVVVEVETAPKMETEAVAEIDREVKVLMDVDFDIPEDSLKSKEWLQKKVNKIIEEQKIELKEAAKELEEIKLEMNFAELETALKELDIEQIKNEMQEQQAELRKELEEFSNQNLIEQLELEKELQKKELSNELKEIESDRELSEKEKIVIKERIQETIERINSKEYKDQLKKNIERSKKSLQEHLDRIESGEFEQRLQKQRESLKKHIEKYHSPEYRKEFQDKLERSKERIYKHLEKLNTLEYRDQLEKIIQGQEDSKNDQFVFAGQENSNFIQYSNLKFKGEVKENMPLYIIDDSLVDSNHIKYLDPDNIDGVSVLKNQKAIEIYGKEAEHGVVLIKSKNKGKNKPAFLKNKEQNGKDKPLYILDGKKISAKRFDEISPNQIKSINFIKGESAIEKYGKNAKNGVMEITLKK
ncbi:M56 family metallopeptidase [Marinifilum sp.]|uniref:M56 family metallopeptidase n=1 Tax=Marinifilum sp. TaxID=2033137 RepID=UPI003BAA00E4